MGVDLHMYLIRDDGECLMSNLFDGRDSEWFDNLSYRYSDEIYGYLPHRFGIPENVPDFIKSDVEGSGTSNTCYGFSYMPYKAYREWFFKYRPDEEAGWVTTYDRWRMKSKGIIPDAELIKHFLDKSDVVEDMEFISFINPDNRDQYIIKQVDQYCEDHKAKVKNHDLNIVYYFDC